MDETLAPKQLEYTGKVQPKPEEIDPETGQLRLPYLPNEGLIEAVNMTIALKRPLLLKGEPGCGKTRLAQAIAYELDLPFEAWYIKSTGRARDGLYTYDAVGRLRDAQLAAAGQLKAADLSSISEPAAYVRYGPLGRAFLNPERTVVLIDEIDKADIDFPNDLLLELDEKRFVIEETGQVVRAKAPPIVLITSNDEKDLPDAFLRRCLFHYVQFPDPERLMQIINSIFPDQSQELVQQAIARFLGLREEMRREKGNVGKKVSTSELIDWFDMLHRYPEDDVLKKLKGTLPYAGVLLKSWDDHRRFITQVRGRTDNAT